MDAVYATICYITCVVLMIIMVKVIKKVGATDFIMPMMLFMLQLASFCNLPALCCSLIAVFCVATGLFFVSQMLSVREATFMSSYCPATVFPTIPCLFLALAVLLNINKWIYFTLRIQTNINIREFEISEMVAEEQEEVLEQIAGENYVSGNIGKSHEDVQ